MVLTHHWEPLWLVNLALQLSWLKRYSISVVISRMCDLSQMHGTVLWPDRLYWHMCNLITWAGPSHSNTSWHVQVLIWYFCTVSFFHLHWWTSPVGDQMYIVTTWAEPSYGNTLFFGAFNTVASLPFISTVGTVTGIITNFSVQF